MWYHIWLKGDPAIIGKPLALKFVAIGHASVYLDGERIKDMCIKDDKGQCNDHQTDFSPVFLSLKDTSAHLLSIRYGQEHLSKSWGFSIKVSHAGDIVDVMVARLVFLSSLMLPLAGMYLSFFLIHLFMFLLHSRDKSNFFFALFSLSAFSIFIIGYRTVTGSLDWAIFEPLFHVFFVLGLCALIAFSNLLFSTSRRIIWVFSGFCVLYLLFDLFQMIHRQSINTYVFLILFAASLLYILFLYIRAMYRKFPGSYILGAGMVFTGVFILAVICLFVNDGNLFEVTKTRNSSHFIFTASLYLSLIGMPISISAFLGWRSRLAQKELKKHSEELAKKNESLRAIAQMQSHDIRQPLTSLMGLLDLADQGALVPDREWFILAKDAAQILDDKIHAIVNESMGDKDIKLFMFNKMVEEIEDYAILLINKNGMVENWNKGAEIIKGYRSSEIVGRHFSLFYTKAQQKAGLPQEMLNVAVKEGVSRNEGPRVRKDGSQFLARVVITTIHNRAGEVLGFTKVTRKLAD